jgi:anti-anti-sigma regulatory factor
MTSSDRPYEVQPARDDVVVVFAQYVDHERRPEHDRELDDLVERHELVICDISGSRKITSDWLRFLLRLSVKAKKMGKRMAIVGMGDNVKETSDVLGLLDDLQLYPSLEEARRT